MSDTRKRRWFQFNLRAVLWLLLCVAIGMGAYRWGYDAGLTEQENRRHEVGNAYLMVYYVSDMTPGTSVPSVPQVDFTRLIDELTTDVLPNTWPERGGAARIKEFATNQTLIVSHDQDGHERIANYLKRRRHEKTIPLLSSK